MNQAQPKFCVELIERALNRAKKPVNGSNILILGTSYKGGVGDTRESPALKIIAHLQALGGDVRYHDPYVPDLPRLGLSSVDLESALSAADLVAIVTAHPGIDYENVVRASAEVVDLRGTTRGIDAENLTRL